MVFFKYKVFVGYIYSAGPVSRQMTEWTFAFCMFVLKSLMYKHEHITSYQPTSSSVQREFVLKYVDIRVNWADFGVMTYHPGRHDYRRN